MVTSIIAERREPSGEFLNRKNPSAERRVYDTPVAPSTGLLYPDLDACRPRVITSAVCRIVNLQPELRIHFRID